MSKQLLVAAGLLFFSIARNWELIKCPRPQNSNMVSFLRTLSWLETFAAWKTLDHLCESLDAILLRLAATVRGLKTFDALKPALRLENDKNLSDCDPQDQVFDKIRDTLDLDAVAAYCTRVRGSLQPGDNGDDFAAIDLATTMNGSFNISWKVVFEDGVSWLLKIPAAGTPDRFSDAHAEALRSEACTMRLLRRETTIPVPEVFAFSDSCSNELGHPFILMQFIEGKPLYEFWEDKKTSKDTMKKRRIRCLQAIAAAMVQLDKFSFDQAGALKFDKNGQPLGIGPMLAVDDAREFWKSEDGILDDEWAWVTHEPFHNDRDYYMADMNRLSKHVVCKRPKIDYRAEGWIKLFNLFFDSLERKCHQEKQFVLAHPDLSCANIIVSDEGLVRAFIDWDKAHVVPRTLGNETYPNWLTEDWTRCEFEELHEPPETLKFYRSVYAKAIQPHHRDQLKDAAKVPIQTGQPNGSEDVLKSATTTTKSLIYACLYRIGSETLNNTKDQILIKLVDEMASIIEEEQHEKVRSPPGDDDCQFSRTPAQERLKQFKAMDLLDSIGEGKLSDQHRRLLLFGFEGLLRRSGEF